MTFSALYKTYPKFFSGMIRPVAVGYGYRRQIFRCIPHDSQPDLSTFVFYGLLSCVIKFLCVKTKLDSIFVFMIFFMLIRTIIAMITTTTPTTITNPTTISNDYNVDGSTNKNAIQAMNQKHYETNRDVQELIFFGCDLSDWMALSQFLLLAFISLSSL